ncbi:alpha/beta fold hydrolase [Fulvivirga sediminis]|uniref:Alpha/beta hydrolase n=1 Tax=Fulvivirga sediminis TaxID=2803949 RepID=A0A937F368_9BACT|nr:alpha/beta hydrolase [Fulvivirga sediminis]MBL3655487.1 alpha/beta hydrolase [Fulvivirga sediminis]
MPVINIPSGKLHVQELEGNSEDTVILIHGLFGNLSLYYFNIAPQLSENYRVLMYDLRGHGKNSKEESGYHLNQMTQDLEALIDYYELEKVHLAGYSFGGLIALKMAMIAPERIDKLMIIDAPDLSGISEEGFDQIYEREFIKPYLQQHENTHKEVESFIRKKVDKNISTYNFLMHKTALLFDLTLDKNLFYHPDLKYITNETLLLYASSSCFAKDGKTLSAILPSSSLKYLEGNHSMPMISGRQVGKELHMFLKELNEYALTVDQ